ncbi:MAG: gluconate 2-dehydrogenase subunit 3 family protein [Gammaproteobacteria bacterium]|nr:gluconate 2-dehydrogenase subunit 3 family protein [Gammaproteobacteria bacterium]
MNNRSGHKQAGQQYSMQNHTGISRREFMARMGLLGSLALSYPAKALAELRVLKANHRTADSALEWQSEAAWQTIAQVQETLFPAAEDVPGASDFGADVYLYSAIENPNADGEDKDFIMRGVGWLDDLAQQRLNKTFLQLTRTQQQEIIETIVKSRAGRNWVSILLSYILEALLTGPVYGGNKNGIGWKWLQHQPGYPSPPADKTWDQLSQRRYTVT